MEKTLSEKINYAYLTLILNPQITVFFDKERIKQGKLYINDYLRSKIDVKNCLIELGNLSIALAPPDVKVIRREIFSTDKEEMKMFESRVIRL